MSIENNEQEVAKVTSSEEKSVSEGAASAMLQDVMDTDPLEGRRHRHHNVDFGPIHINRPTSTINALQYTVRDGKITVKSR